jgi:hypothetical protein
LTCRKLSKTRKLIDGKDKGFVGAAGDQQNGSMQAVCRVEPTAMASRPEYSTRQLFNFAKDSYLERTSRPIYALIFLLPFIVFYEMGTVLSNTDALAMTQDRVVAFIWLQSFLDKYLGLGSRFAWVAPPLAVIVILIGLQLASRKQWHFGLADFGPMTIECMLLAVPLIVLSLFLSGPARPQRDMVRPGYGAMPGEVLPTCSLLSERSPPVTEPAPKSRDARSGTLLANIVTGIGAGIYEELIFRLVLMCALMLVLQDLMGLSQKGSVILSVLVSAALFSAHHHIIFVNGQLALSSPFSWPEFSFRTIAGVYFAVLFAIRGFGITAGTHAFYDIIATMVNLLFFGQ